MVSCGCKLCIYLCSLYPLRAGCVREKQRTYFQASAGGLVIVVRLGVNQDKMYRRGRHHAILQIGNTGYGKPGRAECRNFRARGRHRVWLLNVPTIIQCTREHFKCIRSTFWVGSRYLHEACACRRSCLHLQRVVVLVPPCMYVLSSLRDVVCVFTSVPHVCVPAQCLGQGSGRPETRSATHDLPNRYSPLFSTHPHPPATEHRAQWQPAPTLAKAKDPSSHRLSPPPLLPPPRTLPRAEPKNEMPTHVPLVLPSPFLISSSLLLLRLHTSTLGRGLPSCLTSASIAPEAKADVDRSCRGLLWLARNRYPDKKPPPQRGAPNADGRHEAFAYSGTNSHLAPCRSCPPPSHPSALAFFPHVPSHRARQLLLSP